MDRLRRRYNNSFRGRRVVKAKEMEDTSQPSLTITQTIVAKLISFISRVCPITPKT
jgi:hypothetical protein